MSLGTRKLGVLKYFVLNILALILKEAMKYLKTLDHPKYPQKTNKDGTPKSDLVFERKIATANENLTISLIEKY